MRCLKRLPSFLPKLEQKLDEHRRSLKWTSPGLLSRYVFTTVYRVLELSLLTATKSAIDTVQPETSNGIAERAAPESDKVDGDGRQDARQEPIGKHPEQNGQWESNGDIGQGGPNGNFPFGAMSGGFPNIGINGTPDFNQMMPFMANGMPNNLMGTFPNMMSKHDSNKSFEEPR